jgi:uncharacterized protein YecE (DUF72 family)
MVQLRVGTGGWDYFSIPSGDRLKAYSSAYGFVEVNSTYYRLPSSARVSGWRRRVPPGFEFSVRCHRDLAELHRLELNLKSARIVDSMEKICRSLRANVLALLIPKPLIEDEDLVPKLNTLLSSISLRETKIGVEFRGGEPKEETLEILQDHDASHIVDISKQIPAVESTMLYSRLFGKGKENAYEFDDDELRGIAAKASGPKFEKSILAFHGVRMYRDAARLKIFMNSGKFPSITGQVGLESLREVLNEDTRFPISKSNLVDEQGWKLYDMSSEERGRLRAVLQKLPEKTYASTNEIMTSLKEASRFTIGLGH